MMLAFEDLLARLKLDRVELTVWIEEGWVRPSRKGDSYLFDEADLARIRLIREMGRDMMINDEAMPVVLSLLDQLYATRSALKSVIQVLDELPAPARKKLEHVLRDVIGP